MAHRIRVAFFLAHRYLTYSNKWMTGLVIFVMTLTYLNMVVVVGILEGLPEGARQEYEQYYSGDVLLTPSTGKRYMEQTPAITGILNNVSKIENFTVRYVETGIIEAHYQDSQNDRNKEVDQVSAEIVGVDPLEEEQVTGLSQFITEGSFLSPHQAGFVIIGSDLLESYSPLKFAGFDTLSNLHAGDKILIKIGDVKKEMIVGGILDFKARPANRRVYMLRDELQGLLGKTDYNSDEIAIRGNSETSPEELKSILQSLGLGNKVLLRTSAEAQGKLLADLQKTFDVLGNVIGGIAIVVASVTIFVSVFIIALNRSRYIGILKGIGVDHFTINTSYVLLSFFYTIVGILVGILITYLFLVPYFHKHPIDFPFNYGVLKLDPESLAISILVMLGATLVASYTPAKFITRRNTLDAILGR